MGIYGVCVVILIGRDAGRVTRNVVEIGVGEGIVTTNDAVHMLVGDSDDDSDTDNSAYGRYGGLVYDFVL